MSLTLSTRLGTVGNGHLRKLADDCRKQIRPFGLCTMCDFHDFGLTFFSINVFFVLLKMSKNVFWVVARLPQRLKSTFFEIFSNGAALKGPAE